MQHGDTPGEGSIAVNLFTTLDSDRDDYAALVPSRP